MPLDTPSLDGIGGEQGPSLLRNGLYNLGGATVRGLVVLLTVGSALRRLYSYPKT